MCVCVCNFVHRFLDAAMWFVRSIGVDVVDVGAVNGVIGWIGLYPLGEHGIGEETSGEGY